MVRKLETVEGVFELQRLPQRRNEQLQAWDAADEYLLQYCTDIRQDELLILNDNFGALTVALHKFKPMALSDSYLSQQATLINLSVNNLDDSSITLVDSLNYPERTFDWVLIKIPKSMALFEDQLIRLKSLLKPTSVVMISCMVKAMPKSAWSLIERYLGEVKSSLIQKKARVLFVTLKPIDTVFKNPFPSIYRSCRINR